MDQSLFEANEALIANFFLHHSVKESQVTIQQKSDLNYFHAFET